MPKQPTIRWTKAQIRELRRDVSVFNRVRTLAIKKDPSVEKFLPQKLNVQELKAQIKSRQQLKNLTNKVNYEVSFNFELFEQPEGEKILKSELELTRSLAKETNRLKEKERKRRKIKAKQFNQMGTFEQAELKPVRTDVENIKAKDWARFRELVEAKSTPEYYKWEAEAYKEIYIETLWDNLGATEETLELVEFIQNIPAQRFVDAARDNEKLRIRFIYPNDPAEVIDIRQQLLENWALYK